MRSRLMNLSLDADEKTEEAGSPRDKILLGIWILTGMAI
jgi:hypothetical protein